MSEIISLRNRIRSWCPFWEILDPPLILYENPTFGWFCGSATRCREKWSIPLASQIVLIYVSITHSFSVSRQFNISLSETYKMDGLEPCTNYWVCVSGFRRALPLPVCQLMATPESGTSEDKKNTKSAMFAFFFDICHQMQTFCINTIICCH